MGQAGLGLGLGAVREDGTERRGSDGGEETGEEGGEELCSCYYSLSELTGLGLRSLSDFTGEYGQVGPILPLSVV